MNNKRMRILHDAKNRSFISHSRESWFSRAFAALGVAHSLRWRLGLFLCPVSAGEHCMKTDTSTLKDLVEVLNDGKKFYEEASSKVDRPELKQLFDRMAHTKAAIAGDLQT